MTAQTAGSGWMFFFFGMFFVPSLLRAMFGRESTHWIGGKAAGTGRLQKRDVQRLDEALAQRDAVIEDLQLRLSEMESRLDFTERLIARNTGGTETLVR